jgi:hypothetical protein
MQAFWNREFGEQWQQFLVEPEHVVLAQQAAKAWEALACDLARRRGQKKEARKPGFATPEARARAAIAEAVEAVGALRAAELVLAGLSDAEAYAVYDRSRVIRGTK